MIRLGLKGIKVRVPNRYQNLPADLKKRPAGKDAICVSLSVPPGRLTHFIRMHFEYVKFLENCYLYGILFHSASNKRLTNPKFFIILEFLTRRVENNRTAVAI